MTLSGGVDMPEVIYGLMGRGGITLAFSKTTFEAVSFMYRLSPSPKVQMTWVCIQHLDTECCADGHQKSSIQQLERLGEDIC
jgi:hypothetical protein